MRLNYDDFRNLIIDKHFGIFTRNYIDFVLRYSPKEYSIIIVDFDHVKQMNISLGYKATNDIFRRMFMSFHRQTNAIIGRWFSGDEIVLLTLDDPYLLLSKFELHCSGRNLHYKLITVSTKKIEDLW